MSNPDRNRIVWRDFAGAPALTIFQTAPGSTSALVLAGAALLDVLAEPVMVTVRQEILRFGPAAGLGNTGAYASHRDVATMFFESLPGTSETPIPIIGPNSGIFLADGMTIDQSNVDVAAAIAWMIANGVDSSGNAFTRYVRGFRSFIPGGP